MVSLCGEVLGHLCCPPVSACVHVHAVVATDHGLRVDRVFGVSRGILGISDSRKSGHTLNLSLQHNPHNERIQAPLHALFCLAFSSDCSLAHRFLLNTQTQAHTLMLTSVNWVIWKSEGDEHMFK